MGKCGSHSASDVINDVVNLWRDLILFFMSDHCFTWKIIPALVQSELILCPDNLLKKHFD